MAEKLDLFPFLSRLNRRDMSAYDNLTEDQKKEASALVIMRWLSGTSDPAQIVRLNAFANKYIFSLGNEKGLLFKLLAASCTARASRNSWLKGPSSKSSKLAIEAIKQNFQCSTREAKDYQGLLSSADILRYAEDAGWETAQLKKLTTELGKDDEQGSAPPSRRKPKK